MTRPTIATLARHLANGETMARELLELALERAEDPAGEGPCVFTKLHKIPAQVAAAASDALRAQGVVPSPLAGIPVSVKDLFDIAGEPTMAGSIALRDAPAAAADAPVIARLRAAGAVIVGRTNMTEFAFSGIGHNPHYCTPRNPYDREAGRIPGGSSSGAAVSVTDGMAIVGLGTDTGGSVRIPAALCGIAGFKPTARRVPLAGTVPLSFSLDSIGPLASTLADCALVDAVLAGGPPVVPPPASLAGLRLLVPENMVLDGMDGPVSFAFDRCLGTLSHAGVHIVTRRLPPLDDLPAINAKGGFAAAEAYAWHRELLEKRGGDYDPRVRLRIERGAGMTAAEYVELLQRRPAFQAAMAAQLADFDAMLMPTVPVIAPTLAEIAADAEFTRLNMLILRNTSIGNFLDGCSLTLPCHRLGEAPVGAMLTAPAMQDQRLLSIGLAVEGALATAST